MNPEKLTQKSQEAISGAQQLAVKNQHTEVTPVHLLVALLAQSQGLVGTILKKAGRDPTGLLEAARSQPPAPWAVCWPLPTSRRRPSETTS
jgi:ATP-dependent Clp protease ATP-binding subunit ClpB